MKIYNERHQKALYLKNQLDIVQAKQMAHIHEFEGRTKGLTPDQRKRATEAFERVQKKYNERESSAYSQYYNHMHEDFDIKGSKISYADKKYKNGFTDEKYINDMYRKQAKEKKRGKK